MRPVFESLSDRLQSVFQKLKGRGKLSEKDVEAALREVRLALLEADVNFKVVRDFLGQASERGPSGTRCSEASLLRSK